MKQSVGAPGRLASAQSVRTLRRNSAGMAEKTCVSIRRGGVSRYIIFLGSPVAERVDLRGWGWPRRLVLPVIPGWSEGPDPESRDSGFDAAHRPGMTTQLSNPTTDRKETMPASQLFH